MREDPGGCLSGGWHCDYDVRGLLLVLIRAVDRLHGVCVGLRRHASIAWVIAICEAV